MRLAPLALALAATPSFSTITSITLSPLPAPLLAGSSIQINFTFVATDAFNLTQGRLFPYLDGLQFGAEVGPLGVAPGVPALAWGSAFIPLPWGPATSRMLQLAAHAPPRTFTMGAPPPPGSLLSNAVPLTLTPRAPARPSPRVPGAPLLTMYMETWFTPLNTNWSPGDSVEALPHLGRYASVSLDAIRSQAAQLTQAGVDVIIEDWTNNLWSRSSWGERQANIQELVNATSLHLGVYASLRRTEKWDVPQFVLLLGLNNGPTTPLPALVEELDFIAAAYLANATLAGSFPQLDGKPLVLIFDGTGANHTGFSHPAFTIRWMASQLQATPAFARRGYWSWMDGSLAPQITAAPSGGAAEAVTLAPAFFSRGGWLNPAGAMGRSGGLTLLATLASALAATRGAGQPLPRFVNVCQFNEFAGQPNNSTTDYTDSYSPDLSNDLEPTSPFGCAYPRPGGVRCGGGWGYRGLNAVALVRAALSAPATVEGSAIIAVLEPAVGVVATYAAPGRVRVSWVAARFGAGAALLNVSLPVALTLDGAPVDTVPAPAQPGPQALELDVAGLDARFPHVLRITALPPAGGGAAEHLTAWPLSFDGADADAGAPLAVPVPAHGSVWLWLPESQG